MKLLVYHEACDLWYIVLRCLCADITWYFVIGYVSFSRVFIFDIYECVVHWQTINHAQAEKAASVALPFPLKGSENIGNRAWGGGIFPKTYKMGCGSHPPSYWFFSFPRYSGILKNMLSVLFTTSARLWLRRLLHSRYILSKRIFIKNAVCNCR